MNSLQLTTCKGNVCSSLVVNGKSNVLSFLLAVGLTLVAINYAQKRIK